MTYARCGGTHRHRDGPRCERRWYLWRSGGGASGVISNAIDQMRYAALHVGASRCAQGAACRNDCADAQRIAACRQHVRIDRHVVDAR